MTMQYVIAGGYLILNKTVFAKELLLADSLMRRLVYPTGQNSQKPKLIKENENPFVKIDFNNGVDVTVDEGFYDVFKKLKQKYTSGVKGKIVIRISAITSYYVTLDLNSEDERVIYEA